MAWVKLVNGIPIPTSDYWISSNNIDKKKNNNKKNLQRFASIHFHG
jgi:hypothetical protein